MISVLFLLVLLVPIAIALVAGIVWMVVRRRPAPGAWLGLLRAHGPLLLGAHLLIFTAILFGTRLAANAVFDVGFDNGGFVGSTPVNRIYSEWAIDLWIGPAAVCIAFLALIVLLATMMSERWAQWRGDIVLIAGVLIAAGIVAFFISRMPSGRADRFWSRAEKHYVVTEPGNTVQSLSVVRGLYMTRELQSGGVVDVFSVALLLTCGLLIVNFPGVRCIEPRLSRMAIWGGFSIVCCWPATTFFGIIAVWQIKRSGRKLYGLRLAAVEALLIPWILIIGSITIVFTFILIYMLMVYAAVNRGNGPPAEVAWQAPFLISILPALVIGFFPCRAAWRAVVGRPAQVKPALPAPDISLQPSRIGAISLILAITGVVLPILMLFVESQRRSASDGDVLLCLSLGVALELAALGCGIVGRRTPAGKAGVIIALVALLLYVLVPSFFFVRHDSHATTHSEIESSTVSKPAIRTERVAPSTTQVSPP